VAAGERAANLMTIIASAVRNDLDVGAYLRTSYSARCQVKRTGRQWHRMRGKPSIPKRFAHTAKTNAGRPPTASAPAALAVV
jgi:hypothetical protein